MLRARKIRIKPSEIQKRLFHRWFSVIVLVHNEALTLVTEKGIKSNFFSLSNYLLNEEANERSILLYLITNSILVVLRKKQLESFAML
jgi:hypothetical protein